MNKAGIKAETLELVGDNIIGTVIPPESVDDAVLWAQDELARRLGVTYTESDSITVSGTGIVELPSSLIMPTRVFFTLGGGANTLTVAVPEYAYAGTFNLTAMIPAQSAGATIVWSANNAEIDGPTNQVNASFDIGFATGLSTMTATVIESDGTTNSGSASVKVIPYTSSLWFNTNVIAPGGYQVMELDLGWSYELVGGVMSGPCWVRIYNAYADLLYDLMRPITADPVIGTHIVWEGIFTANMLTIMDAPDVRGVNGDTPRSKKAYVVVWNNADVTTSPVSFAGEILRTETHTSGIF